MHTCAVIKNGEVRCWGSNNRGQLGALTGREADAGQHSDTIRSTLPMRAGDLTGVAAVTCGGEHSCEAQRRQQAHRYRVTRRIRSPWTMRSRTWGPEESRPKTVYRPSRWGCGECVRKNWEPPVSAPERAIPSTPRS
jgi:hypothetical protein